MNWLSLCTATTNKFLSRLIQHSRDRPHIVAVNDSSSNQEALAIKDKASAKLADVDITLYQYLSLIKNLTPLFLAATGNDDFIRVATKDEKRSRETVYS